MHKIALGLSLPDSLSLYTLEAQEVKGVYRLPHAIYVQVYLRATSASNRILLAKPIKAVPRMRCPPRARTLQSRDTPRRLCEAN